MQTNNQTLSASFGLGTDSKAISKAELIRLLGEYTKKGNTFMSITQVTQFKDKTRNIPFDGFELTGLSKPNTAIAKISQVNGQINTNYENAVNKVREKQGLEGDFVPQETWGEHITEAIIVNGDKVYIQYYPLSVSKDFDSKYVIFKDGKFTQIESTDAKQYKKEYKQPVDQPKIEVRKVSLDSVIGISIGGEQYHIVDVDPSRKAIKELFID